MRQDFEEVVLGYLGYKMSNPAYQDKEAMHLAFKKMINTQLKPEHLTRSNASFRQLLEDYALRSRLQAVEMTNELQVAKFKHALSLVQNTAKQLEETAKEASLTLPPSISPEIAPLAIQYLNEMFQQLKSQEIRKTLSNVFSLKIKDHFFDSNVDAISFEKDISKHVLSKGEKAKDFLQKRCEKAKQNETVIQYMNLYAKWVPYLKAEMIQGFINSNEILDKGVCYALCFRLLEELQLKPEEEGEKPSIQAIDRFRQALYKLKNQLNKTDKDIVREMPKEWLDRSVFQKEQTLFDMVYDPEELDFNKRLTSSKAVEGLKESNGWMAITMTMENGGHAVLMRLDQDRQKAWIFDPNMGLLCFEGDGKGFDQARSECLECFKNMCNVFYPTMYHIKVSQLIPNKINNE